VIVADERSAGVIADRMKEEHAAAAVQFLINWRERSIGNGTAENCGSVRDADHVQLAEGAVDLVQRFVDVRQRQCRKGRKALGPAPHGVSAHIVGHARRVDGMRFVGEVRHLRRNRQDLQVHMGGIHGGKALGDFGVAGSRAAPALDVGVSLSVTRDQIEVGVGPEVGVHVDANGFFLRHSECGKSVEQRGGS
jgi:hypothetical protein